MAVWVPMKWHGPVKAVLDGTWTAHRTHPWCLRLGTHGLSILYGASYQNFYVNSKGQISFGEEVIDWTPNGFPAAEYNQIAGILARHRHPFCGRNQMEAHGNAVYVNYIDVGYYNNQDNLTNSFQIIITSPEVGFCLKAAMRRCATWT